MEIKEILSYYFDQDTKRIDVSFRLTIDSDDEIRQDILKIEEAKEFGYDIITEENEYFDLELKPLYNVPIIDNSLKVIVNNRSN